MNILPFFLSLFCAIAFLLFNMEKSSRDSYKIISSYNNAIEQQLKYFSNRQKKSIKLERSKVRKTTKKSCPRKKRSRRDSFPTVTRRYGKINLSRFFCFEYSKEEFDFVVSFLHNLYDKEFSSHINFALFFKVLIDQGRISCDLSDEKNESLYIEQIDLKSPTLNILYAQLLERGFLSHFIFDRPGKGGCPFCMDIDHFSAMFGRSIVKECISQMAKGCPKDRAIYMAIFKNKDKMIPISNLLSREACGRSHKSRIVAFKDEYNKAVQLINCKYS